ncbi:MAG: hypothetical protein IPL21_14570 [Saprospirales bacterium]|nr:hypothetical protein [Saprospirales bacterium]
MNLEVSFLKGHLTIDSSLEMEQLLLLIFRLIKLAEINLFFLFYQTLHVKNGAC